MGRSRGGLTTKIQAVVDASGLPIALKLTEGQAQDGTSGADMLERLPEDCIVLADRGYDSDALRAQIAAQGALANIRPPDNRVEQRSRLPHAQQGRAVLQQDQALQSYRHRFDKHDPNYLASLKLVAMRLWISAL